MYPLLKLQVWRVSKGCDGFFSPLAPDFQLQAEVSILVKHTADDITVQATSTLNQGANDESFGIYNVVVDPIILTGTGSATWSNGQIDFSKTEDFAAFAGSNLQTFKCPGSIGQ